MTTALPPITEGADHPDVCEDHGLFALYYDDGSPESGPGEPYLDCPGCRDEWAHPMIFCDRCGTERKSERTSLVEELRDPTVVHHLECGHSII